MPLALTRPLLFGGRGRVEESGFHDRCHLLAWMMLRVFPVADPTRRRRVSTCRGRIDVGGSVPSMAARGRRNRTRVGEQRETPRSGGASRTGTELVWQIGWRPPGSSTRRSQPATAPSWSGRSPTTSPSRRRLTRTWTAPGTSNAAGRTPVGRVVRVRAPRPPQRRGDRHLRDAAGRRWRAQHRGPDVRGRQDSAGPRSTSDGRSRNETEGTMTDEARLEPLDSGLAPVTEGWFVVNAARRRLAGAPQVRRALHLRAGPPRARRARRPRAARPSRRSA